MFNRLVSPDASPNSTPQEAVRSFFQLLSPWFWFGKGEQRHIQELHRYFSETFSTPHVFSFSHGRTALDGVLSAMHIGEGDEVFLQAFTCVVVPNSILVNSARPIYVDCDSTYNMDVQDLEKKIQAAKRPRAIIIQHTFGVAADIQAIQAVCKKYNLLLIEDCAHSLFATYHGKLVGTFGDAAIFSFGRDKCVSGVSGGLAILNNAIYSDELRVYTQKLSLPSRAWIAQHIAHPLIFECGKVLFRVHSIFYTAWITLWKKLRVLPLVVDRSEKEGIAAEGFRLPPELAERALMQLRDIHRVQAHREAVVDIYERILGKVFAPQLARNGCSRALLRYTIHHPHMAKIERLLHAEGVYLGRWYDTIVAPKDTKLDRIEYVDGSCPHAEALTQHIANLPTHRNIGLNEAERLALRIRSIAESL